MPALAPLPGFIGPTNTAQSFTVDAERTVNWLLESADAGNPKSPKWYYATPGLASQVTFTGGAHRAAFSLNGRAFCVVGTNFGEVDSSNTMTIWGTVTDDGWRASMASNGPGGNQLMIVAGGNGYIFTLNTNAFAQISDGDFPTNVGMCAFLDGYFIVNQKGTAKFYLSALEDGTSWDPLDVAQKSQTNDFILSVCVDLDRKTVWLLGSQTTEVWWDSGASAFPFEAVPNAILSMGTAGAFAFAQPDDAVIWIGESTNGSRHAYETQGLKADKISTHAVEDAWSQYTRVDDCYTWTMEYRGHSLAVFTFPSADVTWCYDRTEKVWFEWLWWDTTFGIYHAHKAGTHMYAFDAHYVGSRLDGVLYKISGDYLSDDGAVIRRLRRGPHVDSANCLIYCPLVRFSFQVGVGLASGQGSDPQIMLRISRNGGKTWGNERWTSLGTLGSYGVGVQYTRNGNWRDGVLELTVTDPVVLALTECAATARKVAA